jgi:leucyl aminopeptidase
MSRFAIYAFFVLALVFLSVSDAFLLPAGLERLRNPVGNGPQRVKGVRGPEGKRLIETGPNIRAWLTEEEIFAKIRRRDRFMDVTESPELLGEVLPETVASDVPIPEHPTQQKVVKDMIEKIDTENMKAFLRRFTAFHTRYYKSETGSESSRFLLAELQAIADARVNKDEVEVTVTPFTHSWNQPSIIVTITGKAAGNRTAKAGPQKPIIPEKTDAVIIGSHQDSVNGWV